MAEHDPTCNPMQPLLLQVVLYMWSLYCLKLWLFLKCTSRHTWKSAAILRLLSVFRCERCRCPWLMKFRSLHSNNKLWDNENMHWNCHSSFSYIYIYGLVQILEYVYNHFSNKRFLHFQSRRVVPDFVWISQCTARPDKTNTEKRAKSRGVDFHSPARQWCVEKASGIYSHHLHRPGWFVHISPKYNRAGRTLHIEIGHE